MKLTIIFRAAAILLTAISASAHAQNPGVREDEATFTKDQLEEYYKVYTDPAVKHIRVVFNSVLAGRRLGEIEADAIKSADQSYFKSKFIVLQQDGNIMGGNDVTLMFQDRPDKIFTAWVYKKGSVWELRHFEENRKFSKDDIERVKIRYRRFIQDKTHAI